MGQLKRRVKDRARNMENIQTWVETNNARMQKIYNWLED